MRIESNVNFLSHFQNKARITIFSNCQHLNKSSSSAFRPALSNLWLLLVFNVIIWFLMYAYTVSENAGKYGLILIFDRLFFTSCCVTRTGVVLRSGGGLARRRLPFGGKSVGRHRHVILYKKYIRFISPLCWCFALWQFVFLSPFGLAIWTWNIDYSGVIFSLKMWASRNNWRVCQR